MTNELARYTTDSGKEIVLTPDYIRKYISTDESVSMEDMHFFAMMCENYKMNPVLDADLIKYGSNVTIQPKASYWMRIASAHPQFDGMECGITVINREGVIERREGSMAGGSTERLIGGWARVYRKDRQHPAYDEVSLDEYMGRKRDGSPTQAWAKMPATMIRKVAKVHALREAFPECFGGLYDKTEMEQARNEPVAVEIEGADMVRIPVYEEYGPEGWQEMDDDGRMAFVEEVAARDDGMEAF